MRKRQRERINSKAKTLFCFSNDRQDNRWPMPNLPKRWNKSSLIRVLTLKSGSSEIWSDKLSLLHIKGTQRGGEHGGESKQSHGGAEGTKSDRAVVYVLLITLVISSVPPRTNGASVPKDFCYKKPLCSPCLRVTLLQTLNTSGKLYHSKLLKTLKSLDNSLLFSIFASITVLLSCL